jgi:hypothetical protein
MKKVGGGTKGKRKRGKCEKWVKIITKMGK